jgi:hypothetical protein
VVLQLVLDLGPLGPTGGDRVVDLLARLSAPLERRDLLVELAELGLGRARGLEQLEQLVLGIR